MKRAILVCAGLLAAVSAMAQGTVNFATKSGTTVNAPVTDKATGALVGPEFLAGLYFGTAQNSLAPVMDSSGALITRKFSTRYPTTGDPTPISPNNGWVTAGAVTTGIGEANKTGFIQVVAWEASAGASYEAAKAANGKVGASNIIPITLGGFGSPPATPPNLVGLQAFTVEAALIPEPSVIALGLLGGAALLLRRRK